MSGAPKSVGVEFRTAGMIKNPVSSAVLGARREFAVYHKAISKRVGIPRPPWCKSNCRKHSLELVVKLCVLSNLHECADI